MRRAALILLLVAMALVGVARRAMAGSNGCARPDAGTAAARIGAMAGQIDHGGWAEAMVPVDVPPQTRAGIAALKNAVTATVDAYLACVDTATPAAASLRARLAAALGAHPYDVHADRAFMQPVTDVEAVPGAPPWLLVRYGFPLACGNDNLLLVYAFHAGSWRRVARWQAAPYAKISGAYGDFFEYVVLTSRAGVRRIAVAHGTPWCTSRFSRFAVDVIRPGGDPDSAQRVFHAVHGYSRLGPVALLAAPGGFELRLDQSTWVESNTWATAVYRYRDDGDGYHRVQPVAEDPEEFLGAWISAPWKRASGWTEPAARARMQTVHQAIDAMFRQHTWLTYGHVRACPGQLYQVTLHLQRAAPGSPPARSRYFFVHAEGGGVFMLRSSSPHSDATCTRYVSVRRE